MADEYVSRTELNGLGSRVNVLGEDHMECKGRTSQHFDNVDTRMESQHEEITRIFAASDTQKNTITAINSEMRQIQTHIENTDKLTETNRIAISKIKDTINRAGGGIAVLIVVCQFLGILLEIYHPWSK